MKTLILAGEGAIRYMRMGYVNALSNIGGQCLVWHPNSNRPIFDIFNEFEPEVVMCGSWEIDRPLFKNLMKRPHVKVILWGGNWGDMDKEIDYETDKILRVSKEEKDFLPSLIKNNNITCVFSYYHQRWVDVTHNGWKELGVNPIGLPLAADLTQLGIGKELPELKCDVSFLGGYWPYKAINLNKYLIPLCYPTEGLDVKIFGYGSWPVAQHLGILDDNLLPSLFTSSTINLNVFEPLASKYGFDVNERAYKVLACGGFCVSEYCESAAKDLFCENEVVFFKTYTELKDIIHKYLREPDLRKDHVDAGIRAIKTEHNYFVRLKKLLSYTKLYIPEFAIRIEDILKKVEND
jgi:hypothetical protein